MHPAIAYAKQIAYSSEQVLQFTFDQSMKYRDMPDVCYVEAGCAAGAQVIAMKAGAPFKVIYALDSWEGLPRPSNRDNQMPGIRMLSKEEQEALPNPGEQVLESTGAVSVPIEHFWYHIRMAGVNCVNIIPVKGWFEETLPTFDCPPIAILRLDSDLYNSTYVCLKYLYPKVIKGGLVIIDDYALPGCRHAVEDYFTKGLLQPMPDQRCIEGKESLVVYWTK